MKMQNFIIAVILSLYLTPTLGAYSTNNYAKAPIPVAENNDFNFTNMTSLRLDSITSGDIYLISQNLTVNTGNTSAQNWAIWYRKSDSKAPQH